MHEHSRFLAILLVGVAACCGVIAVFSVVVDPYEAFGTPQIAGLTTAKSQTDHVTKPYKVLRGDFDTIIVGSSRARDIFCPDLEALYPNLDVRCYNGGMAHADFAMASRMLVHANTVTPLKRAVVALDFFGFNATDKHFNKTDAERFLGAPGRFPGGILNDVYRLLFSHASLAQSIRNLRRSSEATDHAVAAPVGDSAVKAVSQHNRFVGFYPAILGFYRDYSFVNPHTGASSLEEFKSLLRYCRAEGIETYLLINPFHAIMLDVLREAHLWDKYLQWKQALSKITAEVNAEGSGPQAQLWDFSGYNAVTTEPVLTETGLRDDLEFYADPFHYKRNVGNLMLRRMLAGKEDVPGFGRLLCPEAAADEAARLESGHARFARENRAYIDMTLGRDRRAP